MPGSLLTPHDALSDRSEASYGSADSRVSAKKVSFNRAVRVKQYPWTPDDDYTPESGATHLSLPSRRFWFKVYKVKPQQVQNGDHWRNQNGTAYNGHHSQPHSTNPWEDEDHAEDTYDSLAPIVEDDGADHEDKNHEHSNGTVDDQYTFHQHQMNNVMPTFYGETGAFKENGLNDVRGYNKHKSDSSKPAITKNPVISGFKAVLVKGQAKLKGEKKDTNNRSGPPNDLRSEGYSYRSLSPPKHTGVSTPNYTRNANSEKLTEGDDRSALPIKIPRAESPRRGGGGRDNIERFSIRYKTHQRRSRSTDDAAHGDAGVKQLMSTDKSVSTDDLDSSQHQGKSGLIKFNKDKSTQCNGTLTRTKPLTAYGTPRLSRASFSNLLKRDDPGDRKSHLAPPNGNVKVNSGSSVYTSRSCSLNNRSTDDSRNVKSSRHFEHGARSTSSDSKRSSNQIITKPRIAMSSHRSQNTKANVPAVNREIHVTKETPPQESKNSYSFADDHATGSADVKSTGLYERRRGLGIVQEENSAMKQHWSDSTPLTEGRSSSWERSARPAPATVGHQSGRYIASQRISGEDGVFTSFDANQSSKGAAPLKARDRNRLMTATRETSRPSLQDNESNQSGREFSSSASLLKKSSGPGMIDWSSGFQFGPPTVDRGLASDSECFVHQRQPLLMYIPGVSHHEKPAIEEDRMSGMSSRSRAEMDDDLRPLASATANTYIFSRRNSMPKDSNKNWVKWKVGMKPSRQP